MLLNQKAKQTPLNIRAADVFTTPTWIFWSGPTSCCSWPTCRAKSDQIDINFEKGTLTLHAPVPARQSEDQLYLVHEYGVGDYYRTFNVSESIDAGRISAEYGDGVLTLHLPKAESIKPRKISVNAT